MTEVKTEPEQINFENLTYDQQIEFCSIIAKPMANRKLGKKCYKLLKEAAPHKSYVRCGLKDVQTWIRKGETGIVIFAGDVTPIEVMCHMPIVCEEKQIPYVFTPSRCRLGAAIGMKRGCLMALIKFKNDYEELFNEVKEKIVALSSVI